MTYVVSNLHGHFDEFHRLLQTISFHNDRDILYILGDIVDYGPKPMELINDLSVRLNVYPIAGEHDYTAVRMLTAFEQMQSGKAPSPDFMQEMAAWIHDGGQSTMEGYRALDADAREGVLDYLSDLPLYEEVTVKGRTYLLLHAGIVDFYSDMTVEDLDDLGPEDFFTESLDPGATYFENTTMIVGHTPTSEMKGGNNRILRGKGSIFMDCGLGRGGQLGCLRLEDGEEFYV